MGVMRHSVLSWLSMTMFLQLIALLHSKQSYLAQFRTVLVIHDNVLAIDCTASLEAEVLSPVVTLLVAHTILCTING
jgi:hypothetical protein